MSRHDFPPYFDDNPRIDKVTFAVVPFDSFSGRVVGSGVKASVDGLLDQPIRNLSGLLVFINLPQQDAYGVTVDASEADYFSPVHATFPSNDNPAETRRLMAPLMRLPSFPYAEATTLIRGVVQRGSGPGAVPVRNASIRAGPIMLNPRFRTASDERGAFALPLSIRRAHAHSGTHTVTLHFEQGNDTRTLHVEISEGKSHSFNEPIDLIGHNKPGFFDPNHP